MRRASSAARRHVDFLLSAAAAVLSSAIAVFALHGWNMDLGAPFRGVGDATQVLGYLQNMIESGTPFLGPRLGAPFGQQYYDFPLGTDVINFAMLRVISLATGDPVATANLFYLFTFPLIAVTTYWALRGLGIGRPVAFFGAVVYTIVPFHFLRTTGHLFLAAYWAVPVACYLLVSTLNGKSLFAPERRTGRTRRQRLWRISVPAALAVMIAGGGIYYASFTLILLVPAAAIGWLRTRSRGVAVSSVIVGGLIIGVILVEMLPTFVYQLTNGPNADFPVRGPAETGIHQLRLSSLVMPVPGHRFGPFAQLAARYAFSFPPTGENGESVGLIGVAGLVLLGVVAMGVLAGLFRRRRAWGKERRLAALTIVALLIAIPGGVSTLIALMITPQIRAWGRMSIFIDFFALLAVAILLSVAWRYVRPRRSHTVVALVVLTAIGFAALDQTSTKFIPSYDAVRTEFLDTRAFVQQVEAYLPPGAAVYQLPYRPYPEAGQLGSSPDYDPLQPYISSTALRLSYGGTKGREAGWELYVYGRPVTQVLPILCSAGFSAVWVDGAAYDDDGASLVDSDLRAVLDVEPLVGVANRYAVFDMRDYCAARNASSDPVTAQRVHDELFRPVWVRWGRGARPAQVQENGASQRTLLPPAELDLNNDGDNGRTVAVAFTIASTDGTDAMVSVYWPDGSTQTVGAGVAVSRTLTLAAGPNIVAFRDAGGSSPLHALDVSDLSAVDPDVLALSAQ